jgi:hypothetical protein
MEGYRRLNFEDRGTFQSWLIANAVVGAMALFTLIAALALVYSGDGSYTATAQKEKVLLPDQAPQSGARLFEAASMFGAAIGFGSVSNVPPTLPVRADEMIA